MSVLESVATQPQLLDASPLWGAIALVICLIAALVASACLVIRLMTRPTATPEVTQGGFPPVTQGALEHLQERRDRGEISAQQFDLAWSMLRTAELRRLVGSQRQADAEAGPRP